MRWLRRTDDARRIKGDPPPTYQQLVDKVAELEQARLALAHQCELLDERNAQLRGQNKTLRESNLRLLNDANLLRQRLPRLAEDPRRPMPHLELDPDVTRPYVREPIDMYDAWKDELR